MSRRKGDRWESTRSRKPARDEWGQPHGSARMMIVVGGKPEYDFRLYVDEFGEVREQTPQPERVIRRSDPIELQLDFFEEGIEDRLGLEFEVVPLLSVRRQARRKLGGHHANGSYTNRGRKGMPWDLRALRTQMTVLGTSWDPEDEEEAQREKSDEQKEFELEVARWLRSHPVITDQDRLEMADFAICQLQEEASVRAEVAVKIFQPKRGGAESKYAGWQECFRQKSGVCG